MKPLFRLVTSSPRPISWGICALLLLPTTVQSATWELKLVEASGLEFLPHSGDWSDVDEWFDPHPSDSQLLPGPGDDVNIRPKIASNSPNITLDIPVSIAGLDIYTEETNQVGAGQFYDINADFFTPDGGQTLEVANTLKIRAELWDSYLTTSGTSYEWSNADVKFEDVEVMANHVLVHRDVGNAGGSAVLTVVGGHVGARDSFKLEAADLILEESADIYSLGAGGVSIDLNSTLTAESGVNISAVHTDAQISHTGTMRFLGSPQVRVSRLIGSLSGNGAIEIGESHSLIVQSPNGVDAHTNHSGTISGSGQLWVSGETNSVLLRGSNTFTGDVYVTDGGTLNINRGVNLGALGKELRLIDGTLQAGGNFTVGIPVYINDATIDTQNFNVGASNNWTGPSGTITKVGIGVLELNNNAAGYGGNWVVNEGILESAAGNTFANDTTVTINDPGTLRFTGDENFGAVDGSGGLMSIRENTVKLYKGDALTADFAGRVSGSGIIEKVAGSGGEQRFSGDNTSFTGTWLVNGQMAFASADSLHRPAQIGSSGILVLDPATGDSTHTAEITGGETSRIHKRGAGSIALDNGNEDFFGSYEIVEGTLKFDTAPSAFTSEYAHVIITSQGTLSTNQGSLQLLMPVTIAQDGASIDSGDGSIVLHGAHGGLKGSGQLHKRGSGSLQVFTSSPDFTGGVRVQEGTFTYFDENMLDQGELKIDSGATARGLQSGTASSPSLYWIKQLTGQGMLEISEHQRFAIGEGNDSDYTFSGKLTGDGQLLKMGTGTMTLSGDNRQFGGAIIAANGTLKLSSLNALPDGSGLEIQQAATAEVVVESRASKLQGNGQLRLTSGRFFVGLGDASSTFDGQLSGSRDLWKTGAGTLTLTGNQSGFGGAYMVTGGLLHLANTHTSAIPQITMQGGGIRAGGDITLSKTVFNNGGSIDTNGFDVHLSGSLFGNQRLTKEGLGELRLSGSNNLENTIDVEQGTVRFSATSSIRPNTSLNLQNGTAAVFDADARLRNLTGRGGVNVGPNTLTVSSSGVTEFQGWLLGSGTFDKWSDGELTLSGDASLFSGDFLVRGSNSVLNLDGEYSPSGVFVDVNATLGGNADINALVNIRQFATLAPGMSAGQMTVDELILYFSSTLEIELGGAAVGAFDSVLVEGDAAINGNLNVSLIDGYTPVPGDSLMVLELLGDRTGQFANYEEGGLIGDYPSPHNATGSPSTQLFITYAGGDGNDIVLFAVAGVPEPSTALMLAIVPAVLFPRSKRTR